MFSTGLRTVSPGRRRALALFLLAACAGVGLGAQQAWRSLRTPPELPIDRAAWIWAPRLTTFHGPTSFQAVREFEVQGVPTGARLAILADEEYVVFVNQQLVGTGRYRPGAAVDLYDLASIVRPGANRVVVELRSSYGVGGLLAQVSVDGATPQAIGTDASWTVARRFSRKIRQVGGPLPGESARVWGRPPFGRWGPDRVASSLQLPLSERLLDTPRAAQPVSLQVAGDSWEWYRPSARHLRAEGPGSRVLYDFGRTIEGYLVLELAGGDARAGLLYFGYEPPEPHERPADELLIAMPRQQHWLSAEARRFRYVMVLGVRGLEGVDGYPLRPEAVVDGRLVEPGELPPGAFGLRPPLLRSPPEHELWRQLEGLPSVAVGEEG